MVGYEIHIRKKIDNNSMYPKIRGNYLPQRQSNIRYWIIISLVSCHVYDTCMYDTWMSRFMSRVCHVSCHVSCHVYRLTIGLYPKSRSLFPDTIALTPQEGASKEDLKMKILVICLRLIYLSMVESTGKKQVFFWILTFL